MKINLIQQINNYLHLTSQVRIIQLNKNTYDNIYIYSSISAIQMYTAKNGD